MKVAIVHDYLREYGGAERVVESLHALFPEAPVFVAFYDPGALGAYADRFAGWDIRETAFTRLPFYQQLYSPYRVFSAWAFEQLDVSEYDVVISSTNMFMAKAVKTRPDAKHISYIHTPSRSLYGFSTRTNWKKNPLVRAAGECINVWMRFLDFQTAQNPDVLVANSRTTQARITKYYRRESRVVPPPIPLVDAHVDPLPQKERTYALFVGRLVASKHPEVALEAAILAQVPLKIVGVGPLLAGLKARAAESGAQNITFVEAVTDAELRELYRRARVLLYPAEDEDFGMVPIEAMAVGTPVISHASGEPQFTVQPGKNGEHVQTFTERDWQEALQRVWQKPWDSAAIQSTVQQFSEAHFHAIIRDLTYESRKKSPKP